MHVLGANDVGTAAADSVRQAVLINPQELADLEDAPALARYRERQSAGTATAAPHGDDRARRGLETV
ncbi:hypothetical protein ACIBEA_42305 [Streptomyces sp. NPDC051555]|uniref:hypothetical protein n=1 Tax=Streptomyces sp. NPDC051555 TaxID=3365657 RepID=UPI0037989592